MKSCFLIMRIASKGTAEYDHFLAICNNIKGIVGPLGYEVKRADDVSQTGAITRDLVTRLANADLVIADLTDLNPNVFYELGVRHSLRASGTIMILDEYRTPDIPFDLGSYRVLKYTGTLVGINALNSGLTSFIEEINSTGDSVRDNPVHDWFPNLPANVIREVGSSKESDFRKTIKDLKEVISRYQRIYGAEDPGIISHVLPIDAINAVLRDSAEGLLPGQIMDSMRQSRSEANVEAILEKLKFIVERRIQLSVRSFLEICSWLPGLGVEHLGIHVYDHALTIYPDDDELKRARLGRLTHAPGVADRQKAIREIKAFIGVDLENIESVKQADSKIIENMSIIGLLCDAMHLNKSHDEALKISATLVAAFPDKPACIRNYGRAMGHLGDQESEMLCYRRAALLPDSDDVAAVWLGNTMHNEGKHLLALEAFLLACIKDPNDGANFSLAAQSMANIVYNEQVNAMKKSGVKDLDVEKLAVISLISSSVSCGQILPAVKDRINRTLQLVDLDSAKVTNSMTLVQRLENAWNLYDRFKTSFTSDCPDLPIQQ